FRASTAFLKEIVVAPEEADSWYGISTPCSMMASRWFAVMTRGVEITSPRPSACAADSSRSMRKSGPSKEYARLPAGLATGRFTLYRGEATPGESEKTKGT